MAVYEFAPRTKESYVFPTRLGWHYTVSFKESADYFKGNEILHNSALVFEISFSRSPLSSQTPQKGADPSVKDTILNILYHHLQGQGHLPVYFFVCFAEDEKRLQGWNFL